MGKTRIIAETGAGQHGVATALACAMLDMPCRVYMGAKDVERQSPNVFRMRLMGTEVIPVQKGSCSLKDACCEAMRDWSANYEIPIIYWVQRQALIHSQPLYVNSKNDW